MFVISRRRLREFWEGPGGEPARGPLIEWFKATENADWRSWAEVKSIYAKASKVGHCVVFDIGGNKFRLVARIIYAKHRVYVLKVMTHSEYDGQKAWQRECGCHRPPPTKNPARRRKPR